MSCGGQEVWSYVLFAQIFENIFSESLQRIMKSLNQQFERMSNKVFHHLENSLKITLHLTKFSVFS